MKIAGLDLNFHREGYIFIGIAVVLTFIFGVMFGEEAFFLFIILTAWCCYFFRDPTRITPVRTGLIVSPADGKVVAIEEVEPADDLGLEKGNYTRISIFLNVFDVHVNRIPAEGTVIARYYRTGKFFNASLDKASTDNERMSVVLELTGEHPYAGKKLGVVQIAGLVARRIICTAQLNDKFKAGQRYGIIRFGSRVDVYLPQGINPLVTVGMYMLGGETIIADCINNEAGRIGAKRE